MWGGGSGRASSPEQALRRFNGGKITPGMVEGYFNQQGQYYNVQAGYAPRGDGFSISFNLTPANDANIGVEYASYEKMAQLMGMHSSPNIVENNGFLEKTSLYRTGVGMFAPVLVGTAERAITESSLMSIRHSANPRQEISTLRGLGKAKLIGNVLSRSLGIVAIYDHSSKAYYDLRNGDYAGAAINILKLGLDGFFLAARASNPFVFVGSIIYNITDVQTSNY